MSSISRRIVLLSSAALAGAAFLGPAFAEDLKITIGYQTGGRAIEGAAGRRRL